MGRLLADGPRPVFAATSTSGNEPAVEFLDDLGVSDRLRMVRLFEKLAAGDRLSKEDFRQIRGKIYEFKDYQSRMLCFSNPDGWHVANGFIKKTNRQTPEREIEKAELILASYEEESRAKKPPKIRRPKRRKKNKK